MVKRRLIELRNISQIFGQHQVLSNVDLVLEEGDILGLMGGSGAGKTTLLRIILGIYKPTKGIVLFRGRPNINFNRKVGFASQDDAFYPRLTVGENLIYFGTIYNIAKKEIRRRIPHLLSLFDLNKARKIKAEKLSGGMKRRLGLAIALIHDPDILILDEPTTGLDVVLQKNIWKMITDVQKTGKTIIVSSHNLQDIQKHCNALAFVYQKKVYDKKSIYETMRKHNFKTLEKMFEELHQ